MSEEPDAQVALDRLWDHGGAAFPVTLTLPNGVSYHSVGMSVRDWFAGQALSSEAMFRAYHKTPDLMAEYAYELADAMLKARQP